MQVHGCQTCPVMKVNAGIYAPATDQSIVGGLSMSISVRTDSLFLSLYIYIYSYVLLCLPVYAQQITFYSRVPRRT